MLEARSILEFRYLAGEYSMVGPAYKVFSDIRTISLWFPNDIAFCVQNVVQVIEQILPPYKRDTLYLSWKCVQKKVEG